MDGVQSFGRKRGLPVDDEDDAKTQCFDRPAEKRGCRVIKYEPDDDDDDGINILSLPVRLRDPSPIKKEEDELSSAAGRGSLLTPPSSPDHLSPSPAPPQPRYWHPAFPDRAVRCGRCRQTNTVVRKPASPSSLFNAGRLLFTCAECGCPNNRFGGFICWADKRGVYENNITCDCGLPAR